MMEEAKELLNQLLQVLGDKNTHTLMKVIHTADAVFPLLVRLREYTDAVSEEVTMVLNRQWLFYPELNGYVCCVQYYAGEDGKRGLLFQISNKKGSLRIWYGDEECSHLFGSEDSGALLVGVQGELPPHTAFFLDLLSMAQAQLFRQLTAYADGKATLLLKPKVKN